MFFPFSFAKEEEGDEGDLDDKEEEDHASEEPSPDHSAKYDEETQQLIESKSPKITV